MEQVIGPLAIIVFTVTSGPSKGLELEFIERVPCSIEILETTLQELQESDMPAFARCFYGDGPFTSMRPVVRPEAD